MSRVRSALFAGLFLLIYLIAQLTDLDLGGFGVGLLVIAAVFGLMTIVASSSNNAG